MMNNLDNERAKTLITEQSVRFKQTISQFQNKIKKNKK